MPITRLPRVAADRLIAGYQRHLSPRKGFRCAHAVAHDGPSCSAAVRDIVAERGLLRGARPTALRFLACYQAASLLSMQPGEVRGFCCIGPIPIPFSFGGRRNEPMR